MKCSVSLLYAVLACTGFHGSALLSGGGGRRVTCSGPVGPLPLCNGLPALHGGGGVLASDVYPRPLC